MSKYTKAVLFACFFFFVSQTCAHAQTDEVVQISEKYQSTVTRYTQHFGGKLSPAFVHAIIYVESRGEPTAKNAHSSAQGLMQVTTGAFKHVQEAFPEEQFGNNLLDPEKNIKVGVAYLTLMMDTYGLRSYDALAVGFNKGPSRGVQYSKKPKKDTYAQAVRKMTRQFNEL